MKKIVFLLFLFFISTSLGGTGFVAVGSKVPDVKVVRADGKYVSLTSFKGKVVLINFWATWCPPCVREMPELNKLYKKFHKRGLEVLPIANPRDSVERVKSFFKYVGIRFPYYVDESFTVTRLFGVRALPTTFIVDRKGVVRQIFIGMRPWMSPQFIDYFKSLLKEKTGRKK